LQRQGKRKSNNDILYHLLLLGSGSSLAGSLAGDSLDDTDGDGLTHITDSETAERRILRELLDNHGLAGDELDHGGITRLDAGGVLLKSLAGTTIDLGKDLGELAGDVSSVAIEHRSVAVVDLTRVSHDDNLGSEVSGLCGRIVLGITANVATTDILDGNVLDVETDVVTRDSLSELLVVHLDGLDLSSHRARSEGNDLVGLEDTSLHTTDGHCADTADLVNILQRDTEGLLNGTDGLGQVIKSLKEGHAGVRSLVVPGEVGRLLEHVVTSPARDGDEGNLVRVPADLLKEGGGLLDDLIITSLVVLDGILLVEADDHLLHTEGEGQKSVLTSLAVLGDTSLELTLSRGDDEDGAISLGGTSDHVLDEVTVARGIDDGEVVLGSLELPERDIDGDTTLTLGLELIENPGVLERALAHLGGLLLETLDHTGVDTTASVDKVASSGRLARIYVTDNNQVNMRLLLAHLVSGDLRRRL